MNVHIFHYIHFYLSELFYDIFYLNFYKMQENINLLLIRIFTYFFFFIYSFIYDSLAAHNIFFFATRILGLICLASLSLGGIGSSWFTFDSFAAHSLWYCPRILGTLCLASLSLKGIGSSSFTLNSHTAHNIWFCSQDYKTTLPRFTCSGRDLIKLVYIGLSRST